MKTERKEQTVSIAGLSRALMAGLLLLASAAYAQTADRNAADAALIERVKDAVIKELRESGALDRAVDAGVNRYVERQRAAEAERERREADVHAKTMRPVSEGRDHIRGNPTATVALVEYSDFECPFCKRFHQTVKKVVDESGGRVKWVYRHFPLEELHPVKARSRTDR
ncbi:MAG TPA: thioredoxin domain-containing protein [Casimicrobiaceae bacterium]|jgi:protein-disulfide isomerase|nr:thioredoxin domain-containing protein [Casimicrobiaceae bacterium]